MASTLPPVGCRVTIHGLLQRPELNGRRGRVVSHLPDARRCAVLLDGERQPLSLSAARLCASPPPLSAAMDACTRVALGTLVPGDLVATAGGLEGTLLAIDGRVGVVGRGGETIRSLLRDTELLCPCGERAAAEGRTERVVIGSWPARCELDASGRRVAGRGEVGLSDPIPEGARVVGLELHADGMDQGWGNTADSGLLLAVRRASALASSETLLRLVYDRTRHPSPRHTASLLLPDNSLLAGDRLELFLQCPQYPGWRAHCSSARLLLLTRPPPRAVSSPPPAGWENHAAAAFAALWAALSDGRRLAVQRSHMAVRGLRQQRVLASREQAEAAAETAAALPPRLERLLTLSAQRGEPIDPSAAEKLRRAFQQMAADGGPPPAEPPAAAVAWRASRARRCGAMADSIFAALEAEGAERQLLALLVAQLAEAASHCTYRWERELAMMQDLITGSCSSISEHVEDAILHALLQHRRRLAEAELHAAKRHSDDMHFESHFYASVPFGLPEQEAAERDPNRHTYTQHALSDFSPAAAEARLLAKYTPRHLLGAVRAYLAADDRPADAQLRREKLFDWLAAHVPPGVLPHAPPAARREAWLYEMCHDQQTYELTDAALSYALCRMRVLELREEGEGEAHAVGEGGGEPEGEGEEEGEAEAEGEAEGRAEGREAAAGAAAHRLIRSRLLLYGAPPLLAALMWWALSS
ncbi:hypothetical protein AB1Y20_011000 [Prymnesium parvum]|uniref:Uncharacterized protein n=1 Tax=Prymnesium parvum TaxID=97485 RepID=A0AB34IP71_PRYPA